MAEDVTTNIFNTTSPSTTGDSNATPAHSPSPTSATSASSQHAFGRTARVITPAPPAAATPLTARIATVPTASAPSVDYALPSPMGGGPTSGSYVVPPRPKPGRKPATDEPASKRKAQNRESQRAFRARKAAKLHEMQAQVETAEQRHQREVTLVQAELHETRRQIAQLQLKMEDSRRTETNATREAQFWKQKATHLEAQNIILRKERDEARGWAPHSSRQDSVSQPSVTTYPPLGRPQPAMDNSPETYGTPNMSGGCGDCDVNGSCACMEEIAKLPGPTHFIPAVPLKHMTPRSGGSPFKQTQAYAKPSSDHASIFADREIDFTDQFSFKRPRLDNRPSITFLTQSGEADSKCGFCTDDENCLCRDESLRNFQEPARASDEMPPPSRNGVSPIDKKLASNDLAMTGPGTCPDCMQNPQQRAWCQRVAQSKSSTSTDVFTPASSSRNLSLNSTLDPIDSRNDHALVPDMNMSNRYSIGCSEAFKLFEGRVPVDQDSIDWSNLKPISPTTRKDTLSGPPQRKYSALELDTAGVIATLQQSMAPLVPRQSDGPNVELIRLAQENRRSSDSPLTPLSQSNETGMRRTMSGSPGLPISTLVNGAATSSAMWR